MNVFRIFQGKFEKNAPVSGTLQTSDGRKRNVCYDGDTAVTGHPWCGRISNMWINGLFPWHEGCRSPRSELKSDLLQECLILLLAVKKSS